MYARCANVCCVLLCWCAGVSALCLLPHFSLNLSYTGSWNHKIDHKELQDRPWNLSISNTTAIENGDRTFLITVQLTAPAVEKECQPYIAKKYYKIHSDRKSWPGALDQCAQEGAHLVVIDSQQEADDVIEVIIKAETTRWVHWIGFHDHFNEGDYTTVFNDKLVYNRWAPGEPGGSPSLNCGFFYFTNATNYGLADGNCKQLYRYICERENPALGYETATRENITSASEVFSDTSQERNQSVSQQKNPSEIQRNNQSASQQKNSSSAQGNNLSVNQQKNQENNQSSSQQKNSSSTQGNNLSVSQQKNQENSQSSSQQKNSSSTQGNNLSVSQQKNQENNQSSSQQKNSSSTQGNNQSVSQQKNSSSTQDNNRSVSQQKNQRNNQSSSPQKNSSAAQANQSVSQQKNHSTSQEQNESANEEENPTRSWKQDPISGYTYVPDLGHYKLHDVSQRKSWHEAHATCAQEGSHLLILNSEQEEQVLNTLIDNSHTRGRLHWVGFHDQYRERKYITVCNETLKYAKWYPGRPEGSKQLNCGYYLYHNATHNGLADGDCAWSGPFICEDESVEKRPPLPQSGYLKAPGSLGYYKKYKELMNFQDAIHACAADGSHLIIINNHLEERVMMTIAGKGSHWVGIHDSYEEGKYLTVFNDTLKSTGYTRWYPGDPNNVEWIEEDCIVFTYQSKTRRGLADLNCDEKLPFVCEFDLDKCPRKT